VVLEGAPARGIASGRRAVVASLGVSLFLIPLYPAFITLTAAQVPGVALVPKPLSLALLTVVTCIAAFWIVSLLSATRVPMPTIVPLAAFPAAAALAAILGFDPLAGALFIAILAGGVIWHATILRFVRDRDAVIALFRAYLISGALASLAAIVMVLTKTPPGAYTIEHGRATGTFVVPGELAGYLIVYVPVAFAFVRSDFGLRALAAAGLVLGALAFLLTFSRAGWIGMAAAVAVFVLVRRRRNGARYAVAIMGTAVVAVLLVFNAHHDPSENFTRLSIWDAAVRTVLRFPFSGVGPFEFAHFYPYVRVPGGEPLAHHAHGVVLTIAAEAGLVGVAALFFGWWRFVVALRVRLPSPSAFDRVAVAIAAGLAGTWVQGLIDTVSVVIFGLWLPFMALALVCAGDDPPPRPTFTVARRDGPVGGTPVWRGVPVWRGSPDWRGMPVRRIIVFTAVSVFALVCAFVQNASSAVYGDVGAPLSLPAHLPPQLGTRAYEIIERVAPVRFVETVLADDALRRGDPSAAAAHAARLPAGSSRSDLLARAAAAQGRTGDAIALFLDADDDEALEPFVTALARDGRIREAYDLEGRLVQRLIADGTRPNALAESWWRLGRLATRLQRPAEAARDYARATALAPLNTKYLLDAGTLALQQHDASSAAASFARASEIDPQDADAVAGLGLAALQRGDRRTAQHLSSRADKINPNATLARRLRTAR
jgi:O-antigen ligase